MFYSFKKMIIVIMVVLWSQIYVISAQSEEHKLEVAGQVSVVRSPISIVTVGALGPVSSRERNTIWGGGGRVGYNFSEFLALEAEVNFFPRNTDLEGGKKVQFLTGVKVGKRFEKLGIFAKARPGVLRYSQGDFELVSGALCGAVTPIPISCFTPKATNNFNLDIGGVFELYPSKRTILRFDVGDSVVRRGPRTAAALRPPPPGTFGPVVVVGIPVGSEIIHSLQMNVGVGFRF